MGQGPSRVSAPCEKEQKAWQTASEKYAHKRMEYDRDYEGEQGRSNLSGAGPRAKEVEELENDMNAKKAEWDECLKKSRSDEL